jgi:hypothetical protein
MLFTLILIVPLIFGGETDVPGYWEDKPEAYRSENIQIRTDTFEHFKQHPQQRVRILTVRGIYSVSYTLSAGLCGEPNG